MLFRSLLLIGRKGQGRAPPLGQAVALGLDQALGIAQAWQYRACEQHLARMGHQQGREGFHIDVAHQIGLGPLGLKSEGHPVLHSHGMWSREPRVAAVGFEGSKHPDRHHRGGRLDDREADAGAGGAELSVRAAGSLGKQEDHPSGVQPVENPLQPGRPGAIGDDQPGIGQEVGPMPPGQGAEVGAASRDSSRVEVPFAHVAPAEADIWTDNTTNELRVAVGRTRTWFVAPP